MYSISIFWDPLSSVTCPELGGIALEVSQWWAFLLGAKANGAISPELSDLD